MFAFVYFLVNFAVKWLKTHIEINEYVWNYTQNLTIPIRFKNNSSKIYFFPIK